MFRFFSCCCSCYRSECITEEYHCSLEYHAKAYKLSVKTLKPKISLACDRHGTTIVAYSGSCPKPPARSGWTTRATRATASSITKERPNKCLSARSACPKIRRSHSQNRPLVVCFLFERLSPGGTAIRLSCRASRSVRLICIKLD